MAGSWRCWVSTYASCSGTVQVEAISEEGVTHNIPIEAAATIHFFGLDRPHGLGDPGLRADGRCHPDEVGHGE